MDYPRILRGRRGPRVDGLPFCRGRFARRWLPADCDLRRTPSGLPFARATVPAERKVRDLRGFDRQPCRGDFERPQTALFGLLWRTQLARLSCRGYQFLCAFRAVPRALGLFRPPSRLGNRLPPRPASLPLASLDRLRFRVNCLRHSSQIPSSSLASPLPVWLCGDQGVHLRQFVSGAVLPHRLLFHPWPGLARGFVSLSAQGGGRAFLVNTK